MTFITPILAVPSRKVYLPAGWVQFGPKTVTVLNLNHAKSYKIEY